MIYIGTFQEAFDQGVEGGWVSLMFFVIINSMMRLDYSRDEIV